MNKEQEIDAFVHREVFACQSSLVDELLKREVLGYDDIDNLYAPITDEMIAERMQEMKENWDKELEGHEYTDDKTREHAIEELEQNQEPQEIYEWWIVSDYLAKQLQKHGQPILITEYGTWWGRTTTGQAISMDHVIEVIYKEMKNVLNNYSIE